MIALEEAQAAGSPVAGHRTTDREQIASAAVRRWNSFARRNGKWGGDQLERRIEDLAKVLRDQLEERPDLVGPLMNDYRWLARRLAEVLAKTPLPHGVADTSK